MQDLISYGTETLIREMVCSESDEESMRNPNDVSVSLCAYLSKYSVPTHSNVMKKISLICFKCLMKPYRTFN